MNGRGGCRPGAGRKKDPTRAARIAAQHRVRAAELLVEAGVECQRLGLDPAAVRAVLRAARHLASVTRQSAFPFERGS